MGTAERGRAPREDVAQPELSDVELLHRLAGGDEDAFVCLYRRWQAPLHRFAIGMTGSPHAAEDVVQETFMILMQDAARYDAGRGPVGAYLRGITRHLVFRRIRRESRFVALADGFAQSLDARVAGAPDPDPGQALMRRDDIRAVQSALLRLTPRLREVLVLCDLNDVSYAEAAATLGVPIGTVRSRLSRARDALAQRLERADRQAPVRALLARLVP
jgi:RNA polymerase sigma-70 factor, ECF subfamily